MTTQLAKCLNVIRQLLQPLVTAQTGMPGLRQVDLHNTTAVNTDIVPCCHIVPDEEQVIGRSLDGYHCQRRILFRIVFDAKRDSPLEAQELVGAVQSAVEKWAQYVMPVGEVIPIVRLDYIGEVPALDTVSGVSRDTVVLNYDLQYWRKVGAPDQRSC